MLVFYDFVFTKNRLKKYVLVYFRLEWKKITCCIDNFNKILNEYHFVKKIQIYIVFVVV